MDDTRRAERVTRLFLTGGGGAGGCEYGGKRGSGRVKEASVVCSCLGERVGGGGGGGEYVSLCLSGCFGERDWKFGDAAFKADP